MHLNYAKYDKYISRTNRELRYDLIRGNVEKRIEGKGKSEQIPCSDTGLKKGREEIFLFVSNKHCPTKIGHSKGKQSSTFPLPLFPLSPSIAFLPCYSNKGKQSSTFPLPFLSLLPFCCLSNLLFKQSVTEPPPCFSTRIYTY